MKLHSAKFTGYGAVDPGALAGAMFVRREVFAADDYDIEVVGDVVRISHRATGKAVVVPVSSMDWGVPAVGQPAAPAPQQQWKGKR